MSTTSAKPLSGRRFWQWYVLAWVAMTGLYCMVFLLTGADTVPMALLGAVVYVTPMAVYGMAILAVFRRFEWSPDHKARFALTHLVLALVYSAAIGFSNQLFYLTAQWINPNLFPEFKFSFEYFAWEILMGMLIYGVFGAVCYAIQLHARVQEQAAALALKTKAELSALRAQLNPHFLFNTLHSLLALVRHDPGRAEEALEQFGDLLRYTLDTQKNGEVVLLRDELAFVNNYLSLESLRLGDRLRLDVQVDDDAVDQEVPAFCLQPLVENAIRHAIAPRAEGGRLEVHVRREGDTVVLEVVDDGPGAGREEIEEANGLGMRLVRERIAAHYGDAAELTVDTREGHGFRVTMRLPADRGLD